VPLFALPEGAKVESGSVSFENPDPNTLNVIADDKAVINFDSFDIAENEAVHFIQPGDSATVLSRVTGAGASAIYGSLSANGILFLTNPNGIYFAPSAQVQVNGLVASTLEISTNNFLNGNYILEHGPDSGFARLINRGRISGNNIALLGSAVRNEGVIVAEVGTVHLSSGDKQTVTIDQKGLINVEIDSETSGKVVDGNGVAVKDGVANSGQVSGRKVIMSAKAARDIFENAVNQEGIVRATGLAAENGVIRIVSNARVQVSGVMEAAGGKVEVTSGETVLVNRELKTTGDTAISADKDIEVNADVTTVSGDLDLIADADLDGEGSFTQAPGTTIATVDSGDITIQSSGESTLADISSAGEISLRQGGAPAKFTQHPGSRVSAAGSMSIGEGAELKAADTYYEIGRNWLNYGNFIPDTSSVNLVSAEDAEVIGENRFYDFTVLEPGKLVRFDSETTQEIIGTLTLKGAFGKLLQLTSVNPEKQWSILPRGPTDIIYVSVGGSVNICGPPLAAMHSDSSGNNKNWDIAVRWTGEGADNRWTDAFNWDTGTIPTVTSRVVFDGITGLNANKDSTIDPAFSGETYALILDGYTGTLTLERDFDAIVYKHKTGYVDLNGFILDPNSFWVGGAGDWATASHWADESGGEAGSGTIPADSGTSAVFDANSGIGIVTLDQTRTIGALSLNNSGITLSITTFSLNTGAVVLTDGAITGTSGVITGTSYTVEKGSISAILGGSGVALAKNTASTVTLSGTNTYTGGTTINLGTLYINNTSAIGTGTLTISGGTLDLSANTGLTISGDITVNSGSVTKGTALITFAGDIDYTDSAGGINFGKIAIGTSPDSTTLKSDMTCDSLTINSGDSFISAGYDLDINGPLDVDGTLNIASGAGGNTTMNVAGDMDLTGSTFTATGSTVVFDGATILTSGGKTFVNVAIGSVTSGGSLITADTMRISGTFTAYDGAATALDISDDTVYYYGSSMDLSLLDALTSTNSNVIFNSGDKTLNIGSNTLNDIEIDVGAWSEFTVTGTADMAGDLTLTSVYELSGGTIELAGNLIENNSAAHNSASTLLITMDGNSDTTISGTGGDMPGLKINKNAANKVTLLRNISIFGTAGLAVTSGTFDVDIYDIVFSGTSKTVNIGSTVLNSVTINMGTWNDLTITGTMDVDEDLTISSVYKMLGGTIDLSGNLITNATGTGTGGSVESTAVISMTGNTDTGISGTSGGGVPGLEINKGAANKVTLGTDIWILGTGGFTVTQGSFDSSTYDVNIGGGSKTIDIGSTILNDVNINMGTWDTLTITGTMDVDGDLTITLSQTINGGTIEVAGDLTLTDTGVAGTCAITMNGGTGTDIDATGGGDLPQGTLTIAKTGGAAVSLQSALTTVQALTLTSGILDINGNTLTVNGVFTNNATLALEGDETVTFSGAGGFDEDSGKVLFNGADTYAGGLPAGFGDRFWDIAFDGAGTWQLDTGLQIDNDLTLDSGTFDANDQAVTVNADTDINGGTFKTGASTITFGNSALADTVTMDGGNLQIESNDVEADIVLNLLSWTNNGGTVTYLGSESSIERFSDLQPYFNLVINSGTKTFTQDEDFTIAGTLTITAGSFVTDGFDIDLAGSLDLDGTLDATSGSGANTVINFAGATWDIAAVATFTLTGSTVIFDGNDQELVGSTTFNDFSKTVAVATGTDLTLTFDSTATQTIDGLFTLNGLGDDDRIDLVSDSPDTRWALVCNGTFAIDYVEVTDSDASGGLTVQHTDTIDGGNNINWGFESGGGEAGAEVLNQAFIRQAESAMYRRPGVIPIAMQDDLRFLGRL